jgi:N6-L-threonylcarbamoyladenine synthase
MAQKILGIETSCDDTSVALIEKGHDDLQLIFHYSFSQEKLLEKWGGVVPEIAARNHLYKLVPMLKQALSENSLEAKDIDLMGVTTQPGLLGPLLTGLNTAKSLSLLHQIPIVPVNHLFAHLEAIQLTENIRYPYLGLLVSGGHSAFFLVKASDDFITLGSTIDDAAGEAFDKGGKLLGLGYPAGKLIDQLAKWGDDQAISFPIGLKAKKDASMSFSGLKTALRNHLHNNKLGPWKTDNQWSQREEQNQELYDICASYQKAIVDALSFKTKFALKQAREITGQQKLPIVLGGGVACNSSLRENFLAKYKDVHFVKPEFCTDNGAMIAHYAAINSKHAIAFPECLSLDAQSRFLQKKDFQ